MKKLIFLLLIACSNPVSNGNDVNIYTGVLSDCHSFGQNNITFWRVEIPDEHIISVKIGYVEDEGHVWFTPIYFEIDKYVVISSQDAITGANIPKKSYNYRIKTLDTK